MDKETYIIKKILKYYLPDLKYQFVRFDGNLVIRYTEILVTRYVNYKNAKKLIESYNIYCYYQCDI